MTTDQIKTQIATAYAMAIAAKHATDSNSTLCLTDAQACYDRGDMKHAYNRSVASLAHSVGRRHADYLEVAAMERPA